MTQKELSYVEDAIMHEESIIAIISAQVPNLEDENLVNFMNEEINVHTSMKEKLTNLLEVKANE